MRPVRIAHSVVQLKGNDMNTIDLTALISAVKEHAIEHYEDGGWDIVIECWSDSDIAELLAKHNAHDAATAIDAFRPLIDVWSDRQGPKYPDTYCQTHPNVRLEKEDGESAPSWCSLCQHEENKRYAEGPQGLRWDDASYIAYQTRGLDDYDDSPYHALPLLNDHTDNLCDGHFDTHNAHKCQTHAIQPDPFKGQEPPF
jgi:hypothetical protein